MTAEPMPSGATRADTMTAPMTAVDLMRGRTAPLRLVIFDCDGVIVDSEHISNRLVAEALSALGWAMTTEEATALFLGTAITDIRPRVEARIGMPLPADWSARLTRRIVDAMESEVEAIPGAIEAMRELSAWGLPWRIASNSSHAELAVKFARIGIGAMVAGRVHSFEDVPRGKPAPDLFLAAAAAGGARPAECLVIEDSVAGATAAAAAGMDCLGFDRFADGTALRAVGAVPFHDMTQLPGLLALAMRPDRPGGKTVGLTEADAA